MSLSEIWEMLAAFSFVWKFLGIGLGAMLAFYLLAKVAHRRGVERVQEAALPYPVTVHAEIRARTKSYVLGDYQYYLDFSTDEGQHLHLLTDHTGYMTFGRNLRRTHPRTRRRITGTLTYQNGMVQDFRPDEHLL